MQPWTVGAAEPDSLLVDIGDAAAASCARAAGAGRRCTAASNRDLSPRPGPRSAVPLATEIAQAVSDRVDTGGARAAALKPPSRVPCRVLFRQASRARGRMQDVQGAWQGVVQGVVQGACKARP